MSAILKRPRIDIDEPARSRHASVSVALLLACGSIAGAPAQSAPRPRAAGMPGPWPARRTGKSIDPLALNAGCESCHADIAEQWRASYHSRAYTNRAFQRALSIEPLPFCKGCHAPEANPNLKFDARLTELGVSCVTCHVVDGEVLANGKGSKNAPHPLLRSARFVSPEACANCHQFGFPGEALAPGVAPMQGTITEHAASDFAAISCVGCHMPKMDDGRASHRFDLPRDETSMQRAIRIQARRLDPQHVEVTLIPNGVGHAFPTGDLFRRIEVTAEAVGPEQSKEAAVVSYLTRRFATQRSPGGLLRRLALLDNRLGLAGERRRVVSIDLGPSARPWPIVWRVAYQRVEHPGKVGQPDAELDGEIELARGVLAPTDTPPQVDPLHARGQRVNTQ